MYNISLHLYHRPLWYVPLSLRVVGTEELAIRIGIKKKCVLLFDSASAAPSWHTGVPVYFLTCEK